MNKTLLLIICDFLLLNLLALTRWDAPISAPQAEENKPLSIDRNATPAATQNQDLVDVMKLSLQDEQTHRDALAQQLAQATQTLAQTTQTLAQTSQTLEASKQTAAQLEAQKTTLAATLATTQQTAAQTQQQLQQQVEAAQRDAGVSKERLAQLQRDLETREADLARANTHTARNESGGRNEFLKSRK